MGSKKKIMVVDDEENLLVLVKGLLESEGFKVVTAKSGRECLDRIEAEKPDLLLLDIMMSEVTGIDVAEAIRLDPKLKDIKIIFLTVLKSIEVNPEIMNRLAALDYVTKPFDNNDLLKRVKWALSK